MQNPVKKVLIITYYWPPAGGPGVQRWLKFAKYLPEFGWEPTVFIPENASYPLLDPSLENEVPENLKTIKTKIWEPYSIAEKITKKNKKFKAGQFDIGNNQNWKSKLSIWIRGNFFIPDARIFWVKPSAKYLQKYLQQNHFDAVVTTGPPHSVHLIGLKLKEFFPALKWIADFRDPWTGISYYQHLKLTPSSDQKHRKLENQVFQTADVTLATSFSDAENFRKAGANAVCITNGFDDGLNNETKVKNEKFTLSYVGVLEQLRNPENLWTALENLMKSDENFAHDLEIRFAGRIDDKILLNLSSSNLKSKIQNTGYVSHGEALQEMKRADLLMISNFPDPKSKGIIPGKIFEYLSASNSIISFGPKEADVEKILTETEAGKHFSYDETHTVENFIREKYEEWKMDSHTVKTDKIAQYHRKNLTRQLADIL